MPAPVLPEAFDPYIDPTTGILRNLVGATEQSQLDTLEAKLVTARGIQIVEPPVKVTNDLRQLRTIHQRLFQDVFPWAGELRTVDLRKRTPGAEHFMPVSRLQRGAGFAFAEFADEKYLRGLPKDQFVDRLAHHYDHVNYLHVFREGNGRTQWVFWSQLAQQASYSIDWRGATGQVNDRASRDAMETQDLTGLKTMFTDIVT